MKIKKVMFEKRSPNNSLNISPFPEDLCNSFDRLCSQICENTDDSYVCKCNPGFELLEDRITCIPTTNVLANNEVYTNSTE